jgi:aryl-alcohol dehydrogenase-like predicted oxidoreductase
MAEVALAWVCHRPCVTAPIIGATDHRHPDGALASLDLTSTTRKSQN